jgi:hypothetical protein
MAATREFLSADVLQGEASTALLASRLAVLLGFDNLSREGDALLVVIAINSLSFFSFWSFSNIISDINLVLSSFQNWNATKVSRSTNFKGTCFS